jgi:hypothetical protein
MVCFICIKLWLSYRAYKFITKEMEVTNILNSDGEVFFTKNSVSPLNWLLLKVMALISRN